MDICKSIVIFIVSAVFVACGTESYSTVYNLDFEYNKHESIPARWLVSNPHTGYDAFTDFRQKQHGKSSLQLMPVGATNARSWGFFGQSLPVELVTGKQIELTGWIQTKEVQSGFANLYIYNKDNSEVQGFMLDDPDGIAVRNTTDWTRVSIKREIGDSVEYVTIGGVLKGCGTAWFDNLELTIDGVKFQDSFISAPKTQLSNQDKAELRKYIHPLRTFEPHSGDTEDLKMLGELIGNSKVVALGENTHGSSEVFKMKNRLIQYLAVNEGFDIFSIEANMPESYRLNEYTIEGKGDPKKLIAGMCFWTWNTEEMLNMVEWMRRFNQPQTKITYTGFDMQYYKGPIDVLREAFKEDQQTHALIDQINAALKTGNAVESGLNELQKQIKKSAFDESKKEWLQQQVKLLNQFLGQESITWRDHCMADNILWIKQQNPSSKVVAWAHNMHIQKSGGMMGNRLKESLEDDYINFGFTFYDGSYTAVGADGLTSYAAQCAYPGTLEYLLGQLDEPLFILDLKKIKAENSPIIEWINNVEFRQVGAEKRKDEFATCKITDDFDYLIFIRQSTPSQLL